MENRRYKILLVEDDKLDQMAFKRLVDSEKLPYDYTMAGSLAQAQNIISSERFDVVITDYSLGDGTALDVLALVRDVPVILVTGAGNEDVAVHAWRAGAYDYLTKDVDRNYLKVVPIAVENAVRQKEMKEILDRKQKNLEAIFDAVPVGMLLVDENMVVTRVNDAIRRMFGRGYSQIVNQRLDIALDCRDGLGGEKGCGDRPGCEKCLLRITIKNVLDFGKSVREIEFQPLFRVSDKEVSPWLRISAEPVSIDGRKHVVVAMDDITGRKNAEEMRRRSDERFRLVAKATNDAIWDWDLLTNKLWWSEAVQILFGWTANEVGPDISWWEENVHPEDKERVISGIYDVINGGGDAWSDEYRFRRKDSSYAAILYRGFIIRNDEGKPVRMIGSMMDVTERRNAEEKLKETMEMKAQFVSTVSHELRTPLTCMKEAVAVVLDGIAGTINDKQGHFLDIAKRNIDRLAALINDVLDFQKLGSGGVKLKIEGNDIKEVAKGVYETMALSAKGKGLEFSLEFEGDLPNARFDRDKIIQVLTNLVNNAIKFTPEGGRVIVGVKRQGEELVLHVSDTGMGIPREALSKIFEQFYRVCRPGKEIPGTGLGLSIVKKIVMMHGGKIEVESEMGQGSTFTVFLPLNPTAAEEVMPVKVDEILEDNLVKTNVRIP